MRRHECRAPAPVQRPALQVVATTKQLDVVSNRTTDDDRYWLVAGSVDSVIHELYAVEGQRLEPDQLEGLVWRLDAALLPAVRELLKASLS